MSRISTRTQKIQPSLTLIITAQAAKLAKEGKDIISLGAGEPDFATPKSIKQAGQLAIQENKTRYTAVDGISELKEAIQNKFKRDNKLDFNSNEILVSAGGKQSFYNLFQTILNNGDEVIIPAPYWVSYPDMALLAGGVPVIICAPIEQNFKITAHQLTKAITPKTKAFILNSPSNPTGAVYTNKELKELALVLKQHPNIIIASDDIYEHIILNDIPFSNILQVAPYLKDRTVVINGVSKAYSMTGWRIGYAGGPKDIIAGMRKIQSQSTSNPCSISQYASVEALNGSQDCISTMLEAFKQRHDFVINKINKISGFKCLPAKGAFYAFIDVKVAMQNKGFKTDVEFSTAILDNTGVALVPGSAFGSKDHIRISFATSMENLQESLNRIQTFVQGDS